MRLSLPLAIGLLCGHLPGQLYGDWRDFSGGLGSRLTTQDMDGDGFPDMVGTDSALMVFGVFWNDGQKGWTNPTVVQPRPQAGIYLGGQIAYGDVDGDGDVDALVPGRRNSPNELVVNLGGRRFQLAPRDRIAADASTETLGYTLFDFDADGDLDAFAWIQGAKPRLYLNDGSGKFTDRSAGRLPAATLVDPFKVVTTDLDRDGATDLVIAEQAQVRVWMNGTSRRLVETQAWSVGRATGLLVGDIDGSNGPDIVVPGSVADVFMQTANGQFRLETGRLPFAFLISSTILGDLDEDGDLDLIVGSSFGAFWNDGTGRFSTRTLDWLYPVRNSTVASDFFLADLDGDGDVDVGRVAPPIGYYPWWNLKRHSYCPTVANRGTDLVIELFGPSGEVFAPHVSVAERPPLVIPGIGRWFLKAPVVALSPLSIPAGKKSFHYKIPVPNNPWLWGKKLVFQNVALDATGPIPKVRLMHHHPVTFF